MRCRSFTRRRGIEGGIGSEGAVLHCWREIRWKGDATEGRGKCGAIFGGRARAFGVDGFRSDGSISDGETRVGKEDEVLEECRDSLLLRVDEGVDVGRGGSCFGEAVHQAKAMRQRCNPGQLRSARVKQKERTISNEP